jgi:predicted Zn-dependent peptidase
MTGDRTGGLHPSSSAQSIDRRPFPIRVSDMVLLAALFALCGPVLQTGDAADSPWHELRLDNGISVIILDAPLAEQHAFITMLPLGLLDDEADRAQFAHLVEHLIVHSTDPDALDAEGVLVNGETTGLALRLESFTEPHNWEKAFDRHVSWLAAQDVDPAILEREKANIALEEQSTAANGYTHKWAQAAWNQVVRHGTSHVRVHGDIAGVSAEDARDYLRRRIGSGPGVLFVSVGPVPAEEIAIKVRAVMGELPGDAWAMSAPSVAKESILEVKDRKATWDLEARHYMEWYPVPADTALDRVLADALALLLNRKIQQRGSFQMAGVHALAQADLVSPEGRWLLISAPIPPGVDVELVGAELDEVRKSLGAGKETEIVLQELASQLLQLPDFAEVRRQNPEARWIEAQQLLFLIYAQLNMGLDRQELLAVYPKVNAAKLAAFADMVLSDDNRSTLMLDPAR